MNRIIGILLLAAFFNGCSDNSTGNGDEPAPLKLLGHLSFSPHENTDVWGYLDPATNRAYAIVGHFGNGVTIVDVSNPAAPQNVGFVGSIPGFDVKVHGKYLYTVSGGSSGMGGIVDLSNPAAPQVVGGFPNAHNIWITANGYLIAEYPGVRIYDLNSNPVSPQLLWQGGREGHDASVIGNRLFDFHGRSYTKIYDISDPAAPQELATINDPTIEYNHSGWTSKDGRYLFICDELAATKNPDITVWDISDLSNPQRVAEYNDEKSIVHNIYIIDDIAYVSYYSAGLRLFDVADPVNPKLLAEFDTAESFNTPGFNGAFGVYPYAPGGLIYVSDIETGLYIFRYTPL